jgi:murein DD-endopeptidase MepM/ murein hydrolase activator NlpD
MANIRNSNATTQPLPAASSPILSAAPRASVPAAATSAAAAVATTGSVGTANYPALAPTAARAPSVLGATNGWTAVGGTPVVLQQGESVNTLAGRYGVPASAILAVNGLSGASQAQPGQQLVIPAYNAVQASGQKANIAAAAAAAPIARSVTPAPQLPAAPARVVSAAPMQALPPATVREPLMQPAKAAPAAPVPLARPIQPKVESDAEKRAAAKLAALRAKPADDGDEDAPAKPIRKTDAQLKAEKAATEAKAKVEAAKKAEALKAAEVKKAEEARKLAEAKKAADAKKLAEAKKLADAKRAEADRKAEAAKKVAAATAGAGVGAAATARRPDPETTASIPAETRQAPRAETPAAPAPQAEESSGSSFRWPAQGRVIAGFGARGTGGANDGINIALPEGSPVRAAEGGTVVHADDALKGFGKLVLVRHTNGYVTVYAHNGDLKVKRGEAVKRGQVIATSGQTGNVTSPQLHFEIRKGATPVDPMKYLASN